MKSRVGRASAGRSRPRRDHRPAGGFEANPTLERRIAPPMTEHRARGTARLAQPARSFTAVVLFHRKWHASCSSPPRMIAALVLWSMLGAVAGALAIVTTGRDSPEDTAGSLVIGISGAVVGGLSFMRVSAAWERFQVGTLLTALVGALLFLAVSNLLAPSEER